MGKRSMGISLFMPLATGTLVADGTEQLLVEAQGPMRVSGYVDLTVLQAGDAIILREYIYLEGSYVLYHEEPYAGPSKALYISPRETVTRLKVTLQQTAGAFRTFAYSFVKEA